MDEAFLEGVFRSVADQLTQEHPETFHVGEKRVAVVPFAPEGWTGECQVDYVWMPMGSWRWWLMCSVRVLEDGPEGQMAGEVWMDAEERGPTH